MSPADPKPASKPKPLTFGKPEPKNTASTVIKVILIIAILSAIFWMVYTNSPQKPLNCTPGVETSLIGFGSCTTE